MSYLVLARKWRPRRFQELVGQEHVVRALSNGIETGRLHHAFLFTGTRGVGKTTIARILAKSLNCETGITASPCGQCAACLDIDAGRFVDLIEIDAASRTKVDDTREILDNVVYAPARGRYKVYLIDEVHMLSTSSFNALLKTLEELPPHVKFLLATTDPQKLPATVLSRCLQFNLKRLDRRQIQGQMQHILTAEQVSFEDSGLAALARAADGSMRDGLSLLDQALAFGGGQVREADVLAMLGSINRDALSRLVRSLVDGDRGALDQQFAEMYALSVDYASLLLELMNVWHDIALRQVLGQGAESEWVDEALLAHAASALSAEEVQLYYQLCLMARRDLDLAPDQRTGFEMAMLRLLAFQPQGSTAPKAGPGGLPAARPLPGAAPARSTAPSAAPVRSEAPRAMAAPSPTRAPAPSGSAPAAVAPVPTRPAVQASESGAPVIGAPVAVDARWLDLLERAELRGPGKALAMQFAFLGFEGDSCRVALAPSLEGMATPGTRDAVEQALAAAHGAPLKLKIEVRSVDAKHTAAHAMDEALRARKASAETELLNDPTVGALTREFGARVVPGTLRLEE